MLCIHCLFTIFSWCFSGGFRVPHLYFDLLELSMLFLPTLGVFFHVRICVLVAVADAQPRNLLSWGVILRSRRRSGRQEGAAKHPISCGVPMSPTPCAFTGTAAAIVVLVTLLSCDYCFFVYRRNTIVITLVLSL